jgi:dTDP-4-dehydrorhamnose 3,5-epimerase
MNFRTTALPGVILVEPDVYRDPRGFFLETYHERKYREGGIPGTFVQDNHSFSVHRTLRGLHAQVRHPQGKLVRAIQGEIFDIAVDIDPDSLTYRRWVGVTLSAENFHQLYVPPGYAHGLYVVSESAHVQYKCTDFYYPEDEIAIAWNDPAIGISWPTTEPLLNEKDRRAPLLAEIMQHLKG